MFENHSKSHFASYVHYKIYMNFRAKTSYFTEYNSHILIQFVFRTLFPTRFRRLQCCKMRLFKVVFNHCDPKKRRKKKVWENIEKILKKCRSNRPVLLLAKCTSLFAGFSHHHHEDCVALEVCFLRLLEKELKNRGAKRKIGSEVGEILTQTRRRTKWFFNLLCGQILTSTLKGIENNDYRVSKQVSNRIRVFYSHLKLRSA